MIEYIAIIPDGNRRWAKEHGLPALEGHWHGAKAMHNVVDYLIDHQIGHLTVWGFSMDNWRRNDKEVGDLLNLLALWISSDAPWLNRNNVSLRHIGRLHELPDSLQRTITRAVELTSGNKGMILNLAFNYTGRAEIVDAFRRLIKDNIPSQDIDERLLSRYLYTDGMPDVDLVIRTAGEFRLSNFMLWQTAYSEYYFTDILWPDFDTKELERALQAYSERKRRFGGD